MDREATIVIQPPSIKMFSWPSIVNGRFSTLDRINAISKVDLQQKSARTVPRSVYLAQTSTLSVLNLYHQISIRF